MLQSDVNPTSKLQRLDEILLRANSRSHMRGTEVARIFTALRDTEVQHQPMYWSWFVSIAIVSMMIGLSWSIWLRPTKNCCLYIQKCVATLPQLPEASVTQRLNRCETNLQVMHQGEETTTGVVRRTSSEEVPETSTPTVFVRHGQVTSDHP